MSRHTKILTRSFAGGEMSPEMFSRLDDSMFQAGAETLLNCIPKPTGAVARRPGLKLVRETKDSLQTSRLFPFVFSQDQAVVIEAGGAVSGSIAGGYFRFHTNAQTLLYSHPSTGYRSPLNGSGANSTFSGTRTGSFSVASPTVVTMAAHGLLDRDEVVFVSGSRTLPDADATSNADRPLPSTTYYVRKLTNDTFELYKERLWTTSVKVVEHAGFQPVLANWSRWRSLTTPMQGLTIPEHRFRHLDPVMVTMWPDSGSPKVTFKPVSLGGSDYVFDIAQVTHTINSTIRKSGGSLQQQVLFVASDFGGTLPAEVEEGQLYWVVDWVASPGGWHISETKDGPPLSISTAGSGDIRMCAMPEPRLYGGIGTSGEGFRALRRYYAVVSGSDSHILNLESSPSEANKAGAGVSISDLGLGIGPYRVHLALDVGDTIGVPEPGGGHRTHYVQKDPLEPEFEHDREVMTQALHLGSGSRAPGSANRTSTTQGAYWREMPGRVTGTPVDVQANDFLTGGEDLTFTSISGDHGFRTGQAVAIVDGVAPAGVSLDTTYFAIRDSSTAFRLATTYALAIAGTAIDAPTGWSPQHGSLQVQGFVYTDFTLYGNVLIWPSHGLSNGDTVVFGESDRATATVQTNITLGTVYYVREATTDTFRISASLVGPLIAMESVAGDLMTAAGGTIYEVPHNYSEAELPRIGTAQSGDVMTMASQDRPVAELRRLSATKWDLSEPDFVAAAPVPGDPFEVLVEQGEGTRIVGAAIDSNSKHYIRTIDDHVFQAGNPIYLEGMPTTGAASVPDGYYIVGWPSGQPGYEKAIYLREVESSDEVTHGGTGSISTTSGARVRFGTQGEDRTQSYVVTAIDSNNEESVASAPLVVTVNLFVSGASATIGWAASRGAVRYRVYKELNGLYGLIGETDDLTFKDDNIGPDLGVSPPISDNSLRKVAAVTFNATSDSVAWVGHGLPDGMPVVFKTTDQMPGVNEGQTYYVLDPSDDEFRLSSSPDSEVLVNITGTDTGRHTAVAGNFPAATTYFEGRRVFGGSRSQPQDIWMTASGTESDLTYSIPTVDSDRIYFRIASREVSSIRHLVPLSQLVMLSSSTEYRLTPVNDDALTPASISVRPQSSVGAAYPAPSLVNNTVVFAAARGGHMRDLGYNRDVLGYLSGDISIRAGHLFDGYTIVDQAHSKAPLPVVWCVSSSGKLLGVTYLPEEGIGAWHQHTTPAAGLFESVAVIPEGDEDAVYVIVNRSIGGISARYVERLSDEFRADSLADAFFLDCGVTYQGAATTTVAGLDHLEGELVSYLADGVAGTGTVTSGVLTLSTAATKVHIGLGYDTKIQTLPLSMMRVDAFGTGRQKNINQIWVRLFESGAFTAGAVGQTQRPSRTPASGAIENGIHPVVLSGNWNDDGQIVIQQSDPLPLTVAGLTIEVASGG